MAFFNIEQIFANLPDRAGKGLFIIAVDGGSGAGKSVLAEEWKIFDPSARTLILDDFLINTPDEVIAKRTARENFEKCFDTGYIENHILKPLRDGKTAVFTVSNPESENYLKEFTLKPEVIIVVEGVYSHRMEWRGYFDFRIWLDLDAAKRLERMKKRSANTEMQMLCWQRTEKWYMETDNPAGTADLVINS